MSRPGGRLGLILLVGIATIGAGIYLQAAGGPVLSSDRAGIEYLGASHLGDVLAFQADPDQARPLSNLLTYLLISFTGGAASIRVAAALLHGLNAALVVLLFGTLLRRGGGEQGESFVAPVAGALVFALHPLASEAVLAHGAFAVVAATTFCLLALLTAARRGATEGDKAPGLFVPAALYLAALLCHGGFWPVALVAAVLAGTPAETRRAGGRGRTFIRSIVPFALSLALFYLAWAARQWPAFHFGPVYRPWPVVQGLASHSAALVDAVRLLVLPVGLSVEQGRPAYLGDWNVHALAGVALLILLLAAALRFGRRPTLAGLAMGWFGCLQIHLLLSPPEHPLRERRLYPFILTVAALAAAGLHALERRGALRAARIVAAAACMALCILAVGRVELWEDPVALWESAAKVNPVSPVPWISLGALHLAAGDTDAALQSYEGALARQPRSASIQNSIAEVYLKRGDYQRALQEADKAIDFGPRYLPAYLTLGNSFMLSGKTRDAFLAFNAALAINPDDPGALYNMGALHYQQKQYVKASRLLERATDLRPGDAEAFFRLGMSRFFEGDFAGSAEALRRCLALNPGRIDAKVNLAAALTKTQDHDTAGQLLQEVLAVQPNNAEALNGMAILASARNDKEAARSYFEKAVAADPNNLQFLYNLGGAYEELGQIDQALDAYRKFLGRWKGALDLGEAVRSRIEMLEAQQQAAPRQG
ncbi:MAG TPA: tetratricopeptide repeat protein [Candidatus Saccharimonadales bacterium]|nr:tetratricopeptide repeat protein [Candidatus Saccharimonadales bacterium]